MSDSLAYSRRSLHNRAAQYFREQRLPKEDWTSFVAIEPILSEFDHLVLALAFDAAEEVIEEIDSFYLSQWGYSQRVYSMRHQLLDKISDPRKEVRNLLGLGRASVSLGQSEESLKFLLRALDLSAANGLQTQRGIALANLAQAHFDLGQYDQAIEYYKTSIEIASEQPRDLRGEAARLVGLSVVFRECGDFAAARENLLRGIQVVEGLAPAGRSILGTLRKNLGDIDVLLAHYTEAELHFQVALDISREVIRRSLRSEHEALSGLAAILEDTGDLDSAVRLTQQALDITTEIRELDSEGYKKRDMGRILIQLGRVDAGLKNLEAALEIANSLNVPRLRHTTACELALAYLLRDNPPQALTVIQSAENFIVPRNAASFQLLKGITLARNARQQDAALALRNAVEAAEGLLEKSPDYYSSHYVRALALTGLWLLEAPANQDNTTGVSYFQTTASNYTAKGVVLRYTSYLRTLKPLDQSNRLDIVPAHPTG